MRVAAEDGSVVIYGLHDYPLWHLPAAEASRMSAAQLRAEMRYAARENQVAPRALWAALRAARRAAG